MQKPSISRIVHLYTRHVPDDARSLSEWGQPEGPVTAIITAVHSDDLVNIRAIPDEGGMERHTSVRLYETAEDGLAGGSSKYCVWPPRVG